MKKLLVYATARGSLVFFVAPYLTKSLTISIAWFVTLVPIIINWSKDTSSGKIHQKKLNPLCPDIFETIYDFVMKNSRVWITIAWFIGITTYVVIARLSNSFERFSEFRICTL